MRIFRELMIILSILFLYSCDDILGYEPCDEQNSNWPECICEENMEWPVCGEDGVTYCNHSYLQYHEVRMDYEGECNE